jgi:CHAT domain-containing protein
MVDFYRSYRTRAPKDEALRSAQMRAISGGKYAHPYHWAAFQLYGDWK